VFSRKASGTCRWLYTRAWLSAERPTVLFDVTTARLIERKILLPGVTVLTRLIARVRDRASSRLWRVLAALPNADQRNHLEALLVVRDGDRVSPLDRLRRAPTRISSPAMVDALDRLTELRSFGVNHLDMLTRPEDDNYYEFLLGNYSTIRPFFPYCFELSSSKQQKPVSPRSKQLNSYDISKATPNQLCPKHRAKW